MFRGSLASDSALEATLVGGQPRVLLRSGFNHPGRAREQTLGDAAPGASPPRPGPGSRASPFSPCPPSL